MYKDHEPITLPPPLGPRSELRARSGLPNAASRTEDVRILLHGLRGGSLDVGAPISGIARSPPARRCRETLSPADQINQGPVNVWSAAGIVQRLCGMSSLPSSRDRTLAVRFTGMSTWTIRGCGALSVHQTLESPQQTTGSTSSSEVHLQQVPGCLIVAQTWQWSVGEDCSHGSKRKHQCSPHRRVLIYGVSIHCLSDTPDSLADVALLANANIANAALL
jgi:hypothetical protein